MPTVVKSDIQIQTDVHAELLWDSRVNATAVGVEVDKGVVTLTGTVESYAKKLAAREAAHRVAGVLDVADNVQIRYPGATPLSDTDIAQAVRQALTWDVFVPEERIQSTVTQGMVVLDGDVDRWNQRGDAERAIRNLRGVRGVIDNLRVVGPKIEAHVVREAIEQALERRAEREAKRVGVQVADGTVMLSGNVRSWAEEQAVVQAVAHAPGVHTVRNELHIDRFA